MNYAGVLFPIARPRVTLPFADRTYRVYRDRPHAGVDLAPYPGSLGEPIRASASSVVVDVNRHGNDAAIGNEVVLRTRLPFDTWAADLDGVTHEIPAGVDFSLRYGHCHEIRVEREDVVRAGDVIATIGTTGLSSGPHLHLEVRVGPYHLRKVLDPMHLFVASIVGLREHITGDEL